MNDAEKAEEKINNEKNANIIDVEPPLKVPPFFLSMRFVMAMIAFFGYFILLMFKTDLTIGIVCMVNYTGLRIEAFLQNPNLTPIPIDPKCYFKQDGPYIWSKSERGLALSSFFWGYILAHIPSGWLSDRYGSRNLLIVSNICACIMTITAPAFSSLGYLVFSFNRAALGFFLGTFYPGMAALFVQWTPVADRAKVIGASMSGGIIGSIFTYLIGSVLCDKGFAGGWGSIFYIFGAMGLLWSVALFVFVTDSPANNRFISVQEKEYILRETKRETSAIHKKPPWKAIFKSRICWVTYITVFCQGCGHLMFLTETPTYMREVLKFNIVNNGLMTSIPQITLALAILFAGFGCDLVFRRKKMSKRNIRRFATSIGLLGPMGGCIGLIFITCASPYLAVGMLTIATLFTGFYWGAGALVNINDFAGAYAGLINGITQVFGSLPGIFFPYVIGIITEDSTQEQWSIVFIICGVLYLLGAIIYFIFAESELQPWALGDDAIKAVSLSKVAPLKVENVEPNETT